MYRKYKAETCQPYPNTRYVPTRQMKRNMEKSASYLIKVFRTFTLTQTAMNCYLWSACPAWRRWCLWSSSLCSPQSDRAAALPGQCSASRPLETTLSLWACRKPLTHKQKIIIFHCPQLKTWAWCTFTGRWWKIPGSASLKRDWLSLILQFYRQIHSFKHQHSKWVQVYWWSLGDGTGVIVVY